MIVVFIMKLLLVNIKHYKNGKKKLLFTFYNVYNVGIQ